MKSGLFLLVVLGGYALFLNFDAPLIGGIWVILFVIFLLFEVYFRREDL